MKKTLVLALTVLALAAPSTAAAWEGVTHAGASQLAQAWAATWKYYFVENALADGYRPFSPCIAEPGLGAMGFHYGKPALLADPAIDPAQPELLLYIATSFGLRLIGVEYWKADADQNLATAGDRPSLFGRPFDGPMPGHEPGMPIHYDLHVWLWSGNPAGFFAPFNPLLSC